MVRIASSGFALMLAPMAMVAACGDDAGVGEASLENDAAAVGSAGLDPKTRLAAATDRSRINLTGTVVSTTPNSFVLDYGSDTVTVEMDDWDWFREGKALAAGDSVVVRGRVDDDLWQAKRIEADSVYVRNLNTHFFASAADEEDFGTSIVYVPPNPTPGSSDSTGFVTAVEGQEFTIGSGTAAIRVDSSSLAANKKPQVKIGDRVYVWGDLDLDPQERTEIMAKGIVLLAKDRTRMSGGGTSRSSRVDGNISAPAAPGGGNSQANSASAQP